VFHKADGTVATYTYDVANQLTRILEAGVPTTLTYDQVGNPLTQRNNTQPFNVTMVWDAQSRMTGYQQTGTSGGNPFNQQFTHTYNGDGQRVARQSPVLLVQYVWDGQSIHLKLDSGGSIEDQYHYEPRVYGNLIATGDYWHHYDPLGSTTNLTQSTGGIQASYRYGAWGEITSVFTSGSVVDPFLFVGRVGYYTDDEGIDKNDTSPLLPYYVRARYYNSAWGRWLNRDPIGFDSGDARLYGFVGNDPLNRIDPSGLVEVRVQCPPEAITQATGQCAGLGGLNPAKPPICVLDVIAGRVWGRYVKAFCRDTGDCWATKYRLLRSTVHAWCDLERSCTGIVCCCPPSGSRAPRPDCDEINRKLINNNNCISARRAIMNQCFGGGDNRHRRELQNVIDVRDACERKKRECKC
jgi:RHS repeat-associated protein